MIPTITAAALLTVKIFVLVGIFLYAFFAAIIVRQEQLMANVLEESFEPILRVLAIVHLVFVIGLFILALLIL